MPLPSSLTTPANCFLGECLEAIRPDGDGRCAIGFPSPDGPNATFRIRPLEGVDVRQGDRVLVMTPANTDEPVITGIVESAPRPMPGPSHTITLDGHDMIRVTTSDGRPLVEIGKNQHGPVVRLCGRDVQLDVPGHLKIAAGRLDLESRQGDVRIHADEEVIVQGDMIRLN